MLKSAQGLDRHIWNRTTAGGHRNKRAKLSHVKLQRYTKFAIPDEQYPLLHGDFFDLGFVIQVAML